MHRPGGHLRVSDPSLHLMGDVGLVEQGLEQPRYSWWRYWETVRPVQHMPVTSIEVRCLDIWFKKPTEI